MASGGKSCTRAILITEAKSRIWMARHAFHPSMSWLLGSRHSKPRRPPSLSQKRMSSTQWLRRSPPPVGDRRRRPTEPQSLSPNLPTLQDRNLTPPLPHLSSACLTPANPKRSRLHPIAQYANLFVTVNLSSHACVSGNAITLPESCAHVPAQQQRFEKRLVQDGWRGPRKCISSR